VDTHADTQTPHPDRVRALRRLAECANTIGAARNLWSFELGDTDRCNSSRKAGSSRHTGVAGEFDYISPALATLSSELDNLIPAWIARLIEQLEIMRANQQRLSVAIRDREKLPAIDMDNIVAVIQLQKVLQSVGERIDPHIRAIVQALGTLDQDADHHLLAILEYAGPAVAGAVPKFLEILRTRGISRWPSHLARAIANASRFDGGVVGAVADLLSNRDDQPRHAAIEVLGTIG
jgi:hypothetical protein